jgi:subtilisin-like proprotein convertase family protein
MRKNHNKFLWSIALCVQFLITGIAWGQVANYSFTTSSGTYTAISGGTAHNTSATDEANYSFTLPFTFTYNGTGYTVARPTTNGFLVLGGNAPSTTQYTPLSSGTTNLAIAGFGADLRSIVRSEVIGAAPNRVYVCQWSSVDRWVSSTWRLDGLNFQVRLYETTNVIEIVYGGNTAATISSTVQVGLRGSAFTDFNNRTSTTNWASTTSGSSNSSNVTFSSTVKPSSGLTFTWSPPTPCSGTPTPGNTITSVNPIVSGGTSNLSLQNTTVGTGVTYQWKSSTDNVIYSSISGATSATFSASPSVATYYVCDVTCSGVTTTSNPIQITFLTCYIPTVLTSSSISSTGASIAWTAPVSGTTPASYEYEVRTSGGAGSGATGLVASGSITAPTTTATISGLTGATAYSYYVRSNCGGGDFSPWTSAGTFTTACEVPTSPGAISVSNASSTGFTLTYAAASPAPTAYTLFFTTGTSAAATTIPTLVNGTSYTNGTAYTLGGNSYTCITNSSVSPIALSSGISNTQYNYYLFSRNATNSCFGAPYYSPAVTTSTVTCAAAPTAAVNSSITNNGATVSWTASVVGGGFGTINYFLEVYTDAAYTIAISGSPFSMGTTVTQNLVGLTGATKYYYRIVANNGTCNSAYLTGNFTTLCDAISSLPWTEGFEGVTVGSTVVGASTSLPSCWNSQSTQWTSSDATTYNTAKTGTKYIRYAWSTTNAFMWTPGFQLTAGVSYDFSFYAQGDGFTSWVNDVYVNTSVSSTGATQLTPSYSPTGAGITALQSYNLVSRTFVPTTSGIYYFAIRGNELTGDPWYMAFDDFKLEETPACLIPTALTISALTNAGATLSWTAPSTVPGSGYEVYYSTTNTAPTAGTSPTETVATGTSLAIAGLSANTTYYAWVRSNCDGVNFSSWNSSASFTTSCDPIASLPWTEGFESLTTIGSTEFTDCWVESTGTFWTSLDAAEDSYNDPRTGDKYIGCDYGVADQRIWTPGFQLTAGVSYDFSTYFVGDGYSGWDGSILSNTSQSGTGETVLGSPFISSSTTSLDGTDYTLIKRSFIPSTSGVYYFGIKISANYVPYGYIGFDDFKLELTPAPTITTVSSSVACGGSTLVTITGTNLSSASSVKIGGTTISPLTTNTATQITATVSTAFSGTVEVVTASGTATSASSLTYIVAPVLTINSATQSNCSNVSNGSLTTITSTVGDFDTYTWSPITGVTGDETSGWSFNPTATTSYVLTASNGSGCTNTISKSITVNNAPTAITLSPSTTTTVCLGDVKTIVAIGGVTTNTKNGQSGSIDLSIPDNSSLGISNSIAIASIPATATITKVDVTFKLTHDWMNDAEIVLTAPNGKIIALAADQGSSNSGSYNNVVITSNTSATTLSTSSGTITGTYKANATSSGDLIGSFGANFTQTFADLFSTPNGNWKLSAFDDSNGDMGTLNSWSIVITYVENTLSWSPTATLFTDAAATSAYTGNPTTVYAKPSVNTTYTATATNAAGCSSSSSVAVTIATPSTQTLANNDNVWLGKIDSDWNTASNWVVYDGTNYAAATTVPSATDNVFIPQNNACVLNQPSIGAGTVATKNLFIESNATVSGGSGSIDLKGDFTNNGTFTAGTGTVSFTGTAAQSVTGATTFYNLTQNNADGLTLNNPVTVANNLTMTAGNITTSNLLKLGNNAPASLTWTSGNVFGPMKRWMAAATNSGNASSLFPLGTSSREAKASIEYTVAPTTAGYLEAKYVESDPLGAVAYPVPLTDQYNYLLENVDADGYWEIAPSSVDGVAGGKYTLTVQADGISPLIDFQNYRIIKSPIPHTDWILQGSHIAGSGSNSDFTVSRTDMSDFSFFALASPLASLLPTELVSFAANCQDNNTVAVNWTTASEHNSDYYTVEKSRDGSTWNVLKTIPAAGNSTQLINYSVADASDINGTVYYRLSQYDIDGASKVYDIVSTNCSAENELAMVAYPNPSNGQFTVKIENAIGGSYTLGITDVQGKAIEQQMIQLETGTTIVKLNPIGLKPGVYLLQIVNALTIEKQLKLVVN